MSKSYESTKSIIIAIGKYDIDKLSLTYNTKFLKNETTYKTY